jgi:hypothetical protein
MFGHFAIFRMNGFPRQDLVPSRYTLRHQICLGHRVEPSYIEAFATSMPVSWQISV